MTIIILAFMSGGGLSTLISYIATRKKTQVEIDTLVSQNILKWADSMRQEIRELKDELEAVRQELEACREENTRLRSDISKFRQLLKQD